VDRGAIYIDGQNITEVTKKSLRKAIGVMPQDPVLFNESIAYNIAYSASEEVPLGHVEQVSKEAKIHPYITSLPEGFATVVGERGLKLSGGEKQRIAIARCILKDPPILILDEWSSGLDIKTMQQIQSSMLGLTKGRTTLMIAHHLSTIVGADKIIVLKKGEGIVEQGTHAKLLEQKGEYYSMWIAQNEHLAESEDK